MPVAEDMVYSVAVAGLKEKEEAFTAMAEFKGQEKRKREDYKCEMICGVGRRKMYDTSKEARRGSSCKSLWRALANQKRKIWNYPHSLVSIRNRGFCW